VPRDYARRELLAGIVGGEKRGWWCAARERTKFDVLIDDLEPTIDPRALALIPARVGILQQLDVRRSVIREAP